MTTRRAEVVSIAGADRCQIEGTGHYDPRHGAVLTTMATETEAWGAVCNYDTRDAAAKAACTAALQGWQLEA